ncbi:MAG: alpha/beta hydrolase [Clostridia bacterium]|nr:alpha/beta hydrolase [Clostridia bacterium]
MKKIISVMLAVLMVLACAAVAESECIGEHYTIDVNGVTLNYEVAGEGKPVVLVHGNGGMHQVFSVEIAQLVEAGYQVYAVDSRGQGANEPLDEYHYDDMAEDMYQFITALGLDKPAYYGWSDGGIIGLSLEIAHPNTVGIMAISGTNLSPDGAIPEIIAFIADMVAENPDPLSEMMLVEPNIDPAALNAIEIPVLVTAGSEDLILPEETQRIADNLPNSTLMIVEGHGHETYIENSEIMGEMLIEYLQANNY